MLPKFIYESLPLTNLTIGVWILLGQRSWLFAVSGLLFFAVGALMWVVRSDYRRKDQRVRLRYFSGLSRPLYELKPFVYMACGLITSSWLDVWLLEICGMLLTVLGLFILIKRWIYRRFAVES